MLLLVLGPLIILTAFVFIGKQSGLLADYKKIDATLAAYEKNEKTGEFSQIITFTYMKEVYFFKDAKELPFVKNVLGSTHTVFIKRETPTEATAPAKVRAALMDLSHQINIALPLIALGAICLLVFSQVTSFYFFYVIFLFSLVYFYSFTAKNLFFADFFKKYTRGTDLNHTFVPTFSDEEFKKMKLLDLSLVKYNREIWIKSQRSKGYVFLGLALFCFFLTDFSLNAEPAQTLAVEKIKKGPSINDVLDAGSLDAAQDKYKEKEPFPFCIWFESSSCYFTYKPLDEKGADILSQRVVNFLIQDIGVVFLLVALVLLFSRQIFSQNDQTNLVNKT